MGARSRTREAPAGAAAAMLGHAPEKGLQTPGPAARKPASRSPGIEDPEGPVFCHRPARRDDVRGRRSSGVEHTLGKGGVGCSIHPGGTIFPNINQIVKGRLRGAFPRCAGPGKRGESRRRGAAWDLRRRTAADLQPVLHPHARHTHKLPHVVGDDDEPLAAGMGADLHVVWTARRSGPFQFGAHLSIMGGGLAPDRQHLRIQGSMRPGHDCPARSTRGRSPKVVERTRKPAE